MNNKFILITCIFWFTFSIFPQIAISQQEFTLEFNHKLKYWPEGIILVYGKVPIYELDHKILRSEGVLEVTASADAGICKGNGKGNVLVYIDGEIIDDAGSINLYVTTWETYYANWTGTMLCKNLLTNEWEEKPFNIQECSGVWSVIVPLQDGFNIKKNFKGKEYVEDFFFPAEGEYQFILHIVK